MNRYIDWLFCTLHSRVREPGDLTTRHATRRNFAKDKAEAKANFLRGQSRSERDASAQRQDYSIDANQLLPIDTIDTSINEATSFGINVTCDAFAVQRRLCHSRVSRSLRDPGDPCAKIRKLSARRSTDSTDRRRDIRKSTRSVRNRVSCQPHPHSISYGTRGASEGQLGAAESRSRKIITLSGHELSDLI